MSNKTTQRQAREELIHAHGTEVPNAPKTPRPVKETKPKKAIALDAAAQVLAANSEPMNNAALIKQMAPKKLWTSPEGKTPAATLNTAIIREIAANKDETRFKKVGRGLFMARTTLD